MNYRDTKELERLKDLMQKHQMEEDKGGEALTYINAYVIENLCSELLDKLNTNATTSPLGSIVLSVETLNHRRELAKKATPGPWNVVNQYGFSTAVINENGDVAVDDGSASGEYTEKASLENLHHIAANDPKVTIATIEEVLRLRADKERLEREADWLAHKLCEAVDALMPESLRIKFCVKTVEEAREAAREAVEEVCPQPKELGEVNEYVDVESE